MVWRQVIILANDDPVLQLMCESPGQRILTCKQPADVSYHGYASIVRTRTGRPWLYTLVHMGRGLIVFHLYYKKAFQGFLIPGDNMSYLNDD